MDQLEWKWESHDGLGLFSKGWLPKKKTKAAICLIHGLREHIGRYEHVGKILSDAGYSLFGMDLRGHGNSQGPRGHTPSYDALIQDIQLFITQIENKYPRTPCFLYGHSLGGNLVLNYLLQREATVIGGIVTGPWLRLAFQPNRSKVILAKLMVKIAPGFSQSTNLELAALSRDLNVVEAYKEDPLIHDRISANLFLSIYESGLWAIKNAQKLNTPLLLMHGQADRICSLEASKEFIANAPKLGTLHVFDQFFHEIHNEPDNDEVFKVMLTWIEGQINK